MTKRAPRHLPAVARTCNKMQSQHCCKGCLCNGSRKRSPALAPPPTFFTRNIPNPLYATTPGTLPPVRLTYVTSSKTMCILRWRQPVTAGKGCCQPFETAHSIPGFCHRRQKLNVFPYNRFNFRGGYLKRLTQQHAIGCLGGGLGLGFGFRASPRRRRAASAHLARPGQRGA